MTVVVVVGLEVVVIIVEETNNVGVAVVLDRTAALDRDVLVGVFAVVDGPVVEKTVVVGILVDILVNMLVDMLHTD